MSTILQQPDSLSLLGNMKTFIISSEEDIVFELIDDSADETVFQHVYQPDDSGRVEIDLRTAIEPRLKFILKDDDFRWKQEDMMHYFTAIVNGDTEDLEVSFQVVRGGVANLADSAENFLTGNFLTWQPQSKPICANQPEYLTVYHGTRCRLKIVMYTMASGEPEVIDTYVENDLTEAEGIYTYRVDYRQICDLFAGRWPDPIAFYDIFTESLSARLPPSIIKRTYTQRYYVEGPRSEQEQWYLFENSLGGIDTMRCYGESSLKADHTHNTAEIADTLTEYRTDTERKHTQHTGALTKYERQWLLDFFQAKRKYIYHHNALREIILASSNVEYTSQELPSDFSFTFRFASTLPYLNLPRTETPLEELHFQAPDSEDFPLAPRLYDYARLELSRGALFPVQNPFAEEWNTTTMGAIADFIEAQILANYSGDGGLGHVHTNLSLLNQIALYGRYLTVDAEKIAAALADRATEADNLRTDSTDWAKILRRDQDQTMPFNLTTEKELLLAGLLRTPNFQAGTLGTGARLATLGGKTELELDRLKVRDVMQVNELQVLRETYAQGNIFIGAASCKVVHVRPTDGYDQELGIAIERRSGRTVAIDIDTQTIHEYPEGASPIDNECYLYHYSGFRLYFLAADGENSIENLWQVADMARMKNASNGRFFWRWVASVGSNVQLEDGKLYHYIEVTNWITEDETPGYVTRSSGGHSHSPFEHNAIPLPGDHVVQCGNTSTAARRNLIVINVSDSNSPAISQYKGIGWPITNAYAQFQGLSNYLYTTLSPSGNILRGKSFLLETAQGEENLASASDVSTAVLNMSNSIKLEVKNNLSSAGIDIDANTITLRAAQTIVDSNFAVKSLQTDPADGKFTKITGGIAEFYGIAGVANIRIGLDEYGQAVLQFYNNSGVLLYNLGPSGLQGISNIDEGFESIGSLYTYSNDADSSILAIDWNEVADDYSAYQPSSNRYQYTAKQTKVNSAQTIYYAGRYCADDLTAEKANSRAFLQRTGQICYQETENWASGTNLPLNGVFFKIDVIPSGTTGIGEMIGGRSYYIYTYGQYNRLTAYRYKNGLLMQTAGGSNQSKHIINRQLITPGGEEIIS